jgi:hypothetical protein
LPVLGRSKLEGRCHLHEEVLSVSHSLRRSTAVLSLFALSGCYTYVPIELSSVPAGSDVRVFLTRAAVATLPEDVAPTDLNALYVTGRLEAREADSLMVGVPVGARDATLISPNIRQLVKVRTAEVVDVRRRQFSVPRTALLTAGTVGLGAFVISLIFGANDGGSTPDPNEDVSRVPVGIFPLRVPLFGW